MKTLEEVMNEPKGSSDLSDSYRSNFPGFWQDFVRYVASTQTNPNTLKNLEGRFYSDPQIKRHLDEMKAKEHDISQVLNACIQELGGACVARDDNKTYSIVSEKQLPRIRLPSGGDYDIPLYNFLIKKGVSGRQAKRTSNALKSHVYSKDAGVLVNVGGTVASVLQGDSSSNHILTVGGAKEFIYTYGLQLRWIRGLGEKGYNLLLNSLNSIK